MNKTDLRSIIAKLHELEQIPVEPVNEVNLLKGLNFDFLKGLGKGGKYGARSGLEAWEAAVKVSQREADEALVQAAQTAAKNKPKLTPADIAAARAEGITTQEWLVKNKPEFFAKLEKSPPAEQAQFYDLVTSTAKEYNPERNLKTAIAVSVTGHIILLAILAWEKDKSPSSSSSSSSSSSTRSSLPATMQKGTYGLRPDSIDWESLGAPGFKGQGASLKDGKWSTNGTPVTDPKIIAGLEAALMKQLSTPMKLRLITQADADAAEKQAQAKLDTQSPVMTTKKDSAVKTVPVDPKRRPDLKID